MVNSKLLQHVDFRDRHRDRDVGAPHSLSTVHDGENVSHDVDTVPAQTSGARDESLQHVADLLDREWIDQRDDGIRAREEVELSVRRLESLQILACYVTQHQDP